MPEVLNTHRPASVDWYVRTFRQESPPTGATLGANDLARLLAIKNEAQYDPISISHAEAMRAVNWSERAVRIAVDVIDSLNPRP
jgi:hypothetical protein